jgi:hypothetical protein
MIHLVKLIVMLLIMAAILSVPASTGPRAPTAGQVDQALRVRGVSVGQPFPYSIGGEFWRLKHFGVRVQGSHVILDLDIEPM